MNVQDQMLCMGRNAKSAARALRMMTADRRTQALSAMADHIEAGCDTILTANADDIARAEKAGLNPAMIDRLTLDADRIAGIVKAVKDIAALKDPVGDILDQWTRPNGLAIARVRVPIGTIGIIYESRPNVTADAAALCLRSGNAVILRGGSEAASSNRAIYEQVVRGLKSAGLNEHTVQFVPTTDREAVTALLGGLDDTIDLVVPRGGRSLVEHVKNNARVPVLSHLEGICHVYVHEAADLNTAVEVTVNAKMRRTGICGAAETLLIDDAVAGVFLPAIADALRQKGCRLRGDARAQEIAGPMDRASESDWETEYLDSILSVRVVKGLQEALDHIAHYGSSHTEAIISEDRAAVETFLTEVDSAIVMHNTSTQFADGGEFGLGAEIGIATGRLHARGPVGAEQLTTFKYVVRGCGQVRP